MYNSCMDYDEYDASTSSSSSSASSSLVANNKYLTALGCWSWAVSGTCHPSPARLPHKCRHGLSRLSFSSHHQVPPEVPITICRAAGLLWIAAAGSDCPTIPSNWIHLLRSCIGTVRSGRYVHSSQVQRTEQKTRSYLVAGNLP